MTAPYTFEFELEPKVLLAALMTKAPSSKVRGTTASMMLRILHCVLLVWGGVAIGYGVTDLLGWRPTLMHWSSVAGLGLAYIAVFGSIFITIPTIVRKSLATRSNRGTVRMIVDESGVRTEANHFRSRLQWDGFEGMPRSKLWFVLWFGGNRPSIPFTTFENPEDIDAFEADVLNWLEASR